jgi:hypothetical protein
MKGIRDKQKTLIQILDTKAFRKCGIDGLRDSTKTILLKLIDDCVKYEKSKNHAR